MTSDIRQNLGSGIREVNPAAGSTGRTGTRGRRAFRVVFAIFAAVHALLVLAQPFTAGWSLEFGGGALDWHGNTANAIVTLAFLQIIPGVLARWPGGAPVAAPITAVLIFLAEVVQLQLGYHGGFALHLPLGVAVVGGAVVFAVLSIRWARPRP
ncbi:hypothetical protein [Microbacterium hydrocarbonoxydans]|uniref:hypothetical protein n=1 Tax=Microbacterium hydrocarbonoxydans TaxID=273678 RepID=UPI003D953695